MFGEEFNKDFIEFSIMIDAYWTEIVVKVSMTFFLDSNTVKYQNCNLIENKQEIN